MDTTSSDGQVLNFETIIKNLSHSDSDERRMAVYDLEEFEPEKTIEYLVKSITDENRAVREAASEVLENIPALLSAKLLTPLLGSVRIEVRNIVASVLVSYSDGVVEEMIPALFDENEDVRKFSADILGLAGSSKAVEGLCKSSLKDEVTNVRSSSVEALGKIGSSDALPCLYQIVDSESGTRSEAAEAIGLIGDQSSTEFLHSKISEKDPLVLFGIVEALGNIGSVSSIPILNSMLVQSHDLLKKEIVSAILKIGYKSNTEILDSDAVELLDVLINLLGEQDEEITELVNYQLSLKPASTVLEKFLIYTDDLPSSMLVTLINSASQYENLYSNISGLINHPDDWVAYTAIEALGNYRTDQIADLMIEILNNGSGLKVVAAINQAVTHKLESAVPAIKKLAEGNDFEIAGTAERALEDFKK